MSSATLYRKKISRSTLTLTYYTIITASYGVKVKATAYFSFAFSSVIGVDYTWKHVLFVRLLVNFSFLHKINFPSKAMYQVFCSHFTFLSGKSKSIIIIHVLTSFFTYAIFIFVQAIQYLVWGLVFYSSFGYFISK